MTELSAAAKAILDAGQTGLSPSAATKASVLQGVESNLAGAPASAAAASSVTTSVLSLKLVLVLAVGIAGGLWLSRTGDAPKTASNESAIASVATPETSVSPEPAISNTVATQAAIVPDEPVQASPPMATTNSAQDKTDDRAPGTEDTTPPPTLDSDKPDTTRHSNSKATRTKATQVKAALQVSASPAKSTLAEEQKLISAAQIAIRKADYSTALTLLKSHSTEFPKGILTPERNAATAIAQCKSGQGGKAAGRRFLDKHSQSPLAARVRTSCELPL